MCRKKLVSAVRAATLSVVGIPWRKIDPQIWAMNARSGLPSVGRALTAPPPSLLTLPSSRSHPDRRAVALAGLGIQPPRRHRGVARLTVHGDGSPVDDEVLVRRELDVDPVHR